MMMTMTRKPRVLLVPVKALVLPEIKRRLTLLADREGLPLSLYLRRLLANHVSGPGTHFTKGAT